VIRRFDSILLGAQVLSTDSLKLVERSLISRPSSDGKATVVTAALES